jgi:polygalacturonase
MAALMRRLIRATWLGIVLTAVGPAWAADPQPATDAPGQHNFSVLDYGARGDGATLDTAAINQAIAACAKAGGGQVLFPPGRYLSGTVHLTNHLTLFLAAGAILVGTTNLALYEQPAVPSSCSAALISSRGRGTGAPGCSMTCSCPTTR